MTRTEILIESQPALLELSEDQVQSLNAAGRRLASDKLWWGSTEDPPERNVIHCQRTAANIWSVRVADAVGVIAVDDLRIEVQPKIPVPHLFHLFAASGALPRLDDQELVTASGASLWELVARWYLIACERLLRKDLIRDYLEAEGWLSIIRGRVNATRTTRGLTAGQLEAYCEYEDFAEDIPLNRTLREAARLIAASSLLGWSERRRALAIQARMEGVGAFQRSDFQAPLDRRANYYRQSLTLAHAIIRGQGRALEAGRQAAWTFLFRTPELVETGIREVLRRGLKYEVRVDKSGRHLPGSKLTFNPDLVFNGGQAIADVKYKLLLDDWNRQDLYQVIAFATAFNVNVAAIIGFRSKPVGAQRHLCVGPLALTELFWQSDSMISPGEAETRFIADVSAWLQSPLGVPR